jgi:hypothetical protein
MIPLPQNLRKNGFDYTQVLRGQRSCIYAQMYEEILIAYEVLVIRTVPGQNLFGTWIDSREKFPANEDFGYYAWTVKSLEEAMERFSKLENKFQIQESLRR